MSLGSCRTCERCAGGRNCRYQDGHTTGCSNYSARPNPYSKKKTENSEQHNNGKAGFFTTTTPLKSIYDLKKRNTDIDDPGD